MHTFFQIIERTITKACLMLAGSSASTHRKGTQAYAQGKGHFSILALVVLERLCLCLHHARFAGEISALVLALMLVS